MPYSPNTHYVARTSAPDARVAAAELADRIRTSPETAAPPVPVVPDTIMTAPPVAAALSPPPRNSSPPLELTLEPPTAGYQHNTFTQIAGVSEQYRRSLKRTHTHSQQQQLKQQTKQTRRLQPQANWHGIGGGVRWISAN